jgi:hypothetical protein
VPASQAFFGPPQHGYVDGGAHITMYLVPVHQRRLVVFDVAAREAEGRWLPWDVLAFGGNPYEAAAELADRWCGGDITDLSLADVMSFELPPGSWELAIIFRAELASMPAGDGSRAPVLLEPGRYDAIGPFDPVDLRRWVEAPGLAASSEEPAGPGLLF